MIKKLMKTLALFLLPVAALAVGTCTVTGPTQVGTSTSFVATVACTADAGAATFPATPIPGLLGTAPQLQGAYIARIEVSPGSPSPTANYSLTITDTNGVDQLAAAATGNLSASVSQNFAAGPSTNPINGVLTVNFTGNAVNSAKTTLLIYIAGGAQIPPGGQIVTVPPANASTNITQVAGTNIVTGGVAGLIGVGGNVANAVAATANPVPVGGIFTTTPATLATGQTATAQYTAAQNFKTDLTTVAGTATNTGGLAGALGVGGLAGAGGAKTGNPVLVAGQDGANAQTIATSLNGEIATTISTSGADAIGNASNLGQVTFRGSATGGFLGVWPLLFNGTTWDRRRTAALATFPVSTTLTARNSIGAGVMEKGSRWSVVSQPGVSAQATASIALESGVRHVLDCVSFSAVNNTSAATHNSTLIVNARDGATGAGTVIWTWNVSDQMATSTVSTQYINPHSICGLNLVGTTATAMTVEFSASLTNLIQSVSMSGYNVN